MDEIAVLPFIQVVLGRLKSLDPIYVRMVETTRSPLSPATLICTVFVRSMVGDSITRLKLDTLVNGLEYAASMVDLAEVNGACYAIKLSLKNLQELLFDVDDAVDKLQIVLGGRGFLRGLIKWPELMLVGEAFRTTIENLSTVKKDLTLVPSINNESKSGAKVPDLYGSRQQAVGRDKEIADLLHLVLDGNCSAVCIFGVVGIGKTTLAQTIFDDPKIPYNFDCRLWVGGGRNGDDVRIWKAGSTETELRSVATFKRDLGRWFQDGRVLVVFDDCWDKAVCESFLGAMPDFHSLPSVIVVTTQSRSLASALEARPRAHVYRLEGLPPEASFQILTEMSSGSANFQNDPQYQETVVKIAELCRGIPSALVTVREMLRTNGPMGAQGVLARLEDCNFDEITKLFTLYYDMLPSHLKLPFQTLFLQKACGLSVEALACLWMALGFLYQHLGTQAPTNLLDIGRQYLREFAESDLPSNVEYAPGGVIRDILMHEHIYGLSLSKARSQWVLIHDLSSQKIDKTARYIIWVEDSLPRAALLPDLFNAKKARLFILHTRGQASRELVRGMVSGFKCLRVLGLGGCDIEELPYSIGRLKHLRYLDLGRNARLKRLPSTIFELSYLQTLLLNGCEQLKEISARIWRLKNLMYLTLTTLQKSLPEEIGRLTSLRTLGLAKCQRLASLPRSIKDLKCLETLAIVDCPELDLEADSSVEGFKGNDGIDTVLLRGLPKFVGLPSDLGGFSVAMKHLAIQSCVLLKETVWINQLKSLRSLTIEGCPELSGLVGVTTQFDSLLELVIRSCPKLGSTAWIKQFQSLRSLIIHSCPSLVGLDAGFSELKYLQRLEISECPYLAESCAESGADWKHIEHVRLIELDGKSLKS